MKVFINKEICRLTGICQKICPDVFGEGTEGAMQVYQQPISEEQKSACRKAQRSCPSNAIDIIE